jgi:hypothetical protein
MRIWSGLTLAFKKATDRFLNKWYRYGDRSLYGDRYRTGIGDVTR